MSPPPDKRCEDRSGCLAEIEWAYFNRPDVFKARLLNFSKGGGYFESDQPLIAGATVLIRLRECAACNTDSTGGIHMRTSALGEVKWCRQLEDRTALRYGIGIRYHIPV